ncbi:MAG: glycerophosphodiester phosphodiesterase family protein [Vulcanimicrobiota bacterium]
MRITHSPNLAPLPPRPPAPAAPVLAPVFEPTTDTDWQQMTRLRKQALSQGYSFEAPRFDRWAAEDQGEAAAAYFASKLARPIRPGEVRLSVEDPRLLDLTMRNPGLVLEYLSATPDSSGKPALTEQEQRQFEELHKCYFQKRVGSNPQRVLPELQELYARNQKSPELTLASLQGMRAHVADLCNSGQISDGQREKFESEIRGFLAKIDPAVAAKDTGTAPRDRHIPDLDETFELASKFPGKKILLDTKTSDDPEVARRMASQLRDQLLAHPDMIERVVILNPDPRCLSEFKKVFAQTPELASFKNFSWDDEHLNDTIGGPEDSPLAHAQGNNYLSIGNPRAPLGGNFGHLLQQVRQTRKSLEPERKLLVWTLNDPEQIRQVLEAGADGVLTDDPTAMNRLLDKMGYAADDPKRPMVVAHRGGPASEEYPENTLPALRAGFQSADAVEIDLVSTRDGILLFHDNDPNDTVSLLRNLDLEPGNPWRPRQANLFSEARTRLDQLTRRQVRDNYGYAK